MFGKKPEIDSEDTIRVNVGLTRSCVSTIDELMDSTMLFNSRAEFVTAALRHFTFMYMEQAKWELDQAINVSPRSQIVLDEYVNTMSAVGAQLESEFREEYGGALNVQIAIRLTPEFYTRIMDMNELSPLGIQSLCRMAIKEYCHYLTEKDAQLQAFVNQYNQLFYSTGAESDASDRVIRSMEHWRKKRSTI